MNNPLWEWLIETGLDAYSANEAFSGPSSIDAGPMWCFQRYGQSTTQMPGGRSALIGGEHEDHYDADFYIYNDIVIAAENERPQILGYPRVIRFVEDMYCIQVTFEGEVQVDVVESVRANVCKILESLERTPVVYAEIAN